MGDVSCRRYIIRGGERAGSGLARLGTRPHQPFNPGRTRAMGKPSRSCPSGAWNNFDWGEYVSRPVVGCPGGINKMTVPLGSRTGRQV